MRDCLQAENTKGHNFRVTHFDDQASLYFFTANEVETERWLDKISHTMIQYNKADDADIESHYQNKVEKVTNALSELNRSVKSHKKDLSHARTIDTFLGIIQKRRFRALAKHTQTIQCTTHCHHE